MDNNKYWMSLEQWRKEPQFQELAEREFLSSPFAPDDADSVNARRDFLKLMGASLALTTFGCTRQAQKIVPYAKRPEEVIPGIANYYASSLIDGNEVFGTVVATREGRPIKIEGNSDHPMNLGALSARAHAHLLSLYDPDRLTGPKRNLLNEKKTNRDTINISWEQLDKDVVEALQKGRTALLTGSVNSPSTRELVSEFTRGFALKTYQADAINLDVIREGQRRCYGQNVIPRPRFDRARYIVSFAADFLGTYLSPVEFTKQFSQSRNPNGKMNKLVVFEPTLSLTGANADQRFRVRSTQLVDMAMALLHRLVVVNKRSPYAGDGGVKAILANYSEVHSELGVKESELQQIADELWSHRGESLILAGGLMAQSEQALSLQIAVNFLNSVLGNDGQTIDYKYLNYKSHQGQFGDLVSLVEDIESGKVKRLVIYGTNPIYFAPKSLGLFAALQKLETLIYVGQHLDETALTADYVATEHHALENWGDVEVQNEVLSLQQPTIQPLYNTRSFQDSLITWLKLGKKSSGASNRSKDWYEYLTNQWREIHRKYRGQGIARLDFDDFWIRLKQDGVFDMSGRARESTASSRSFALGTLNQVKKKPASGLELVLYETVGLRDGSLANISWLQELPDPVTRICWDNYLCISPKVAEKEKLQEGQVVELVVSNEKRRVPVHIQPGQHDEVLALAVGYGRTAAGKVAEGVGVAAFDLAVVKDRQVVQAGISAQFSKTKEFVRLANVQGHHSMEGRQIVVEGTLEQYKKSPETVVHKHKIFSLWNEHKYEGHKWAMSIDLNSCTGCGACVVACQSENNIPTVGKKYILQGREMQWIRIDRYYIGDPSDPDTVFQPVTCMHCDNAPCETVCPVAATIHGDEGTNDMIYNRCVGTRYCANNCPYKVRRFNWFNYTKLRAPTHMVLNPEVTVRSRGVMEKCTFCIHRVKYQKHLANVEGREFKATSVQTACQQTCPADAITFGDMNDPQSAVSVAFKDLRDYSVLEELNTRPAVHYKYKVRNVAHLKGGGHHKSEGDGDGGHHS